MRLSRTLVSLAAVLLVLSGCQQSEPDRPERGARVYHVTQSGVSEGQAADLAAALDIPAENVVITAGTVSYVDPETHLVAPQRQLAEPIALEPDEDYDEPREVSEVLDLEALADIEAPNEDEVVARFRDALEGSDLFPDDPLFPDDTLIGTGHATMSIFERDGSEVVSAELSTRVGLSPEIEGHPYVGPGAVIATSFADVDGETQVTSLRYAWRELEQGEWVELLEPGEIEARCMERFAGNGSFEPERIDLDDPVLVYYAPSLESEDPGIPPIGERDTPVATIVPHYVCRGTVALRDGEEANLGQTFIPATDDATYSPTVDLEAAIEGSGVTARVRIEGGRAPYTIEWDSTYNELDPGEFDGTEIAYELEGNAKETAGIPETLTVTVHDANGIEATVSRTLEVPGGNGQRAAPTLEPQVGGTVDFGSESVANRTWGKKTNDKFERVMRNEGVTERFIWDGAMGWERDFHSPHDSTWADNADITALSGHGWPGGISFIDNDHDDGALRSGGEAHGDWGDFDLEWLTFLSCNVLQKNFGSGTNVVQRWGDEFDGLHMLLGFHTLMQLWDSLGEDYAQNLTQQPFIVQLNVVQAWFMAIQQTQDFREGVAMGPIRSDGVSNFSDHFHGEGPVGPDISQNEIERFWVISESGYRTVGF